MFCGYNNNNRYKFRPCDSNSIVPKKTSTNYEINMRVEEKMNAYNKNIERRKDRYLINNHIIEIDD